MEECVAAIVKNDFETYAINYVKTDAPQAVVEAVLAAREDAIRLPPLATTQRIVQHIFKLCYQKSRTAGPILVDLPADLSLSHSQEIFSALAIIKDGHLYDMRWKYRDWWIESPTIWVFGREDPFADMLSEGRLKVRHV